MAGRMAGMEVPVVNTADSIDWIEVSVPSHHTPTPQPNHSRRDAASCCSVGNPPSCFVWKMCANRPNMLDVFELGGHNEKSKNGLRLVFPDDLFPFAFIYEEENFARGKHLMLYAITLSGVAYLIRLRNNFEYPNSSRLMADEFLEQNTEINPQNGVITAVAARKGCLIIGRSGGSVHSFQLGVVLDPRAPGFVSEFRDDAGFGSLWGILSRSPPPSGVQDLAISEVQNRWLVFVLHSDGYFRIWDLSTTSKIFAHPLTIAAPEGSFVRLWVGEADNDTGIVPLAIGTWQLDLGMEILLHALQCKLGDRTPIVLDPSYKKIPLGAGGRAIDVRFTSNKLLILNEEGLAVHHIFYNDMKERSANYYKLQEAYIADLLFQSPDNCSDDLLWLSYSAFSSSKEEVAPFVSSIFLRGLLFSGAHCNAVLRQTMGDYNKHFTDSEFSSFTVDGLKNEILSLIENQGICESPASVFHWWKTFCSCYMNNWCKINAACGLLIDPSTSAIGVVRKTTISLFRSLEDVEHMGHGLLDGHSGDVNPGLYNSADVPDQKTLLEFLQCVKKIRQQLGKASSAIFYESLLRTPSMSSEEIVSRFVKTLETGYSSVIASTQISELGADTAWEKELSNHRNLRKFSADMLMTLNTICIRGTSWGKVLDVVQSYLRFLVPHKIMLELGSEGASYINVSAIVHATSQVAKAVFECALDVLILLSYMTSISGQLCMSHDDVSRVKLELIPMVQEIVMEWHIILYFGSTPSEPPAIEDFSSQLSTLQIDNNVDKRLLNGRLGKCEFSYAYILLLDMQSPARAVGNLASERRLLSPRSLISLSREFTSWIIWGTRGEESSIFFSHSIDLVLILLQHGQCKAAEYLLTLVDAYSRKEKSFESLQVSNGKLATFSHLLGCCFVAQAQHDLHGPAKDRKIGDAVCCFFRTASVEGSFQALQSLPHEAGWLRIDYSGPPSTSTWKLHYYQWAMQLFEQYNMSEAACQFSLAALEQVDEAFGDLDTNQRENFEESLTSVNGRLWANVFKFTLDLSHYHDAYCAIVSNPDEDSKNLCLRRFINVLYERGAVKILCNGELPLIGLADKVERELAWKAERSDLLTKPNPFRLLYAFEMRRHNWRKAASYMYLYSVRLRAEAGNDHRHRSITLQERLNALSVAVNALQLVHPANAWIEAPAEALEKEKYPHKKARMTMQEQSPSNDVMPQKLHTYLDVTELENEYLLTSAEYTLSLANMKWSYTGHGKPSSDLIDLLVESSSYDMAFTVILKFWEGSGLKRELERVFMTMSLKCCSNRVATPFHVKDRRTHGLMLTSSQVEAVEDDEATTVGNSNWETLEHYLESYRTIHPRLPLTVAGTLLSADPQIELPLWLVRIFKDIRSGSSFGMNGNESSPASLFRLYVDYGRYAEAVNLLVEHLQMLASARPTDLIRRKRPFAVWFPYTSVERLWCLLDESIKSGHRVDHCEKLKNLLHGVLLNHLNLLKNDSNDIRSYPV